MYRANTTSEHCFGMPFYAQRIGNSFKMITSPSPPFSKIHTQVRHCIQRQRGTTPLHQFSGICFLSIDEIKSTLYACFPQVCVVGSRDFSTFGSHGADAYVKLRYYKSLDECCHDLKTNYGVLSRRKSFFFKKRPRKLT